MQAGIIGLPNVGKSTLFNAITRTRKAEAANYPFCTIESNVGVVQVPDPRLEPLARILKSPRAVPATVEMVDIAGLVAGASKGDGLGNQFLASIREVAAIIEVVRCFDDPDIVHTMGSVDPLRDIGVIATELILADLQSVENQISRNQKRAKGVDKEAVANLALLEQVRAHLDSGQPVNLMPLPEDEQARLRAFHLLTAKPVIFVCNVDEATLAAGVAANPYVAAVRRHAAEQRAAAAVTVCARLEEDLGELDAAEADAFLSELGLGDSGVSELIRATYELLGLASFLTGNDKETRAWTFPKGMRAPACAGLVHSDFEHNFIKAEVVHFPDLLAAGSRAAAREHGKVRIEGRDYLVQDGDVIEFRCGR
jgi:hypothetical protein